MKRAATVLIVLAGACHGGSPAAVDGASPDAAIDGAADAPIDAPVSPFSFVPASLDFGYVEPNTVSAPIHLTVLSSINGDVPNFSLSFSGDDTAEIQVSQTTCSSTLNSDCMMDIEFAPHAAGDHMMQITASAPGQIPASAPIHAIGGTAPHPFSSGLSYLDFGTVVVGDIYGEMVTYQNSGTTTLPPISFMFAGESPDQYYLTADHCTGVQLAAMTTCSVVVVYAPTSMTPGAAVLYATAVDTDEIDLRANPAPATTLSIAPTSYDFGNVGPGPSASVPFTITNTGNRTATGFSSTIYNSQYGVTSSTCTSLAPGASCEMDVQLAPAATGPDGGGMTVSAANASSATTGFTAIAIPAEGVILDTWSHDFGTAQVGTIGSNYTFTVTNVGTMATTVALSLDDDAADFEIAQDTCSAASLAAGSTCTFEVIFAPQMYSDRFARVHVTSAYNDAIAHLTGSATPGDQPLHIIPSDYNFSTDAIGQIVIEQFDVVSQGGTTKVPTMSLTGPNASEFQIVNNTCSGVSLTASGQSCTVDVWYRPATVGTGKSASLIADWGTGTWTATLEAGAFEDTNAFVTSDPPFLDFGTVAVGQSASLTLPFKNYGAATSAPVGFLIGGINNTEFSLTNDGCTGVALANGDSCTVTVVFAPQSTGTKHGDLQVTVGDGGDPQLTGVGQ